MTQNTINDTESTVPAVENHHMTEFSAVDDSEPVERGKETTTFWHVAYDDEEGDTWLIGVEMDTLTGIMNELNSIRDHDERAGISHDNPDHYYLVTQERTPWKRHNPETTA